MISWVPIKDSGFDGANTSPGIAGNDTAVGDGWIDRAGSRFSRDNNQLKMLAGAFDQVLIRPASENLLDQKLKIYIPAGGDWNVSPSRIFGHLRYQVRGSNALDEYYLFNVTEGNVRIQDFTLVAGLRVGTVLRTLTWVHDATQPHTLECEAIGANPTVLNFTLTNLTTGVVKAMSAEGYAESLQVPGAWGLASTQLQHIDRVITYKNITLTPAKDRQRTGTTKPFSVVGSGEGLHFLGATIGDFALSGGTDPEMVSLVVDDDTHIHGTLDIGSSDGAVTITHTPSGGSWVVTATPPTVVVSPRQVLPGSNGNAMSLVGDETEDFWDPEVTPAYTILDGPPAATITEAAYSDGNHATFDLNTNGSEEVDFLIRNDDSGAEFSVGVNRIIDVGHPYIWTPADLWYRYTADDGTPVARTVWAGAPAKVGFISTTFAVGVRLNALAGEAASHYPIIRYQVDKKGWQRRQMLESETFLEAYTGLSGGEHQFQLKYEVGDNDVNRWEAPLVSCLEITSVRIDASGSLIAPVLLPERMFAYGDSISWGSKQDLAGTPNENDPRSTVPALLARRLGAELYPLCAPGGGIDKTGQGQITELHQKGNPNSQYWRFNSSGLPTLGGGLPIETADWVFNNMGRNDNLTAAEIRACEADWWEQYRPLQPTARIIRVIPFAQFNAAAIRNGINDYAQAHPEDTNWIMVDLEDVGSEGLKLEEGSGATISARDGTHPFAVRNADLALLIDAFILEKWGVTPGRIYAATSGSAWGGF